MDADHEALINDEHEDYVETHSIWEMMFDARSVNSSHSSTNLRNYH